MSEQRDCKNTASLTSLIFSSDLRIVVHCDTPTGALNSEAVKQVGEACSKSDTLFYVDVVSSAGAAPVDMSGWNIDIGRQSFFI